MNNFNFCYWLQGYFELSESNSVPKETVSVIQEHLAIVQPKNGVFCSWLEGYLDMVGVDAWSEEVTKKIRAKLSNEFLTLIDPSYPKNEQEELHRLHFNERPKPRDLLC